MRTVKGFTANKIQYGAHVDSRFLEVRCGRWPEGDSDSHREVVNLACFIYMYGSRLQARSIFLFPNESGQKTY